MAYQGLNMELKGKFRVNVSILIRLSCNVFKKWENKLWENIRENGLNGPWLYDLKTIRLNSRVNQYINITYYFKTVDAKAIFTF